MEGYFDQLLLEPARYLVEKALGFYKQDRAVALAQFSNPKGDFVYGEQYVYALDITGQMLAHGANPDFVGQDFYNVTDLEGKHFIQEIIESARQDDCGCVEYKWLNPSTGTQQPKTVFFTKIDGVIICSGVYGAHPAYRDFRDEPVEDYSLPTPVSELMAFQRMPATDPLSEFIVDDAKKMVEKAIVFYENNDKGVALSEFSNCKGTFVNGELYVFVLDTTGRMLSHGFNGKYVGKDFYWKLDSDGKRFIKEIVDTANTQGSGWVEYKWLHPITKREELKTVYFEKANGVIICCGIYNSSS